MLRRPGPPTCAKSLDSVDIFARISLFIRCLDTPDEGPDCDPLMAEPAASYTMCVPSQNERSLEPSRRIIFPYLHRRPEQESLGDVSPRSTLEGPSSSSPPIFTPKPKNKGALMNKKMTLQSLAVDAKERALENPLLTLSPLNVKPVPPAGNTLSTSTPGDLLLPSDFQKPERSNTGVAVFSRFPRLRTQPPSPTVSGVRRAILPVPTRQSSSLDSDSLSNHNEHIEESDKGGSSDSKGRLISILRPSSYSDSSSEVGKVSSVESDIPSLASTAASEANGLDDRECPEMNHPESGVCGTSNVTKQPVSFDPRILVREFQRCEEERSAIWYTGDEMCGFKEESMKRILAYSRTEIIPTGTGRMIHRVVASSTTKAMFSHMALQMDAPEVIPFTSSIKGSLCHHLPPRIRKVLVVDPHDICCKLFAKSFQNAIPGVTISTASTGEDALKLALKTKFDLILVEERLKLFHRVQHKCKSSTYASGSTLLQKLNCIAKNKSVLVGVSSHVAEDGSLLQKVGGADFVWAKPPPPLNPDLVRQLETVLRGKLQKGN